MEESRVEEIRRQSTGLELVGAESEDGGGETGLEEGGLVGGKSWRRGGGDEGVGVFFLGLLVGWSAGGGGGGCHWGWRVVL